MKHINITTDRKSPIEIKFSPIATRSEIIEVGLAVERFLEEARELRAAITKLNESLPVAKVAADSYLDDVIAGGLELLSDIDARPDMILEAREWDR